MSGHSKWSSIKHKKAAVDAKRGKIFSKIAREILVCARQGGGDASANPTLRALIQKARSVNMPTDNVERAIKKGTGELASEQLEEIMYEGYAPGGVAIVVHSLTDNRNRTTAEVRHLFTRHQGNLAGAGSVMRGFQRKGQIFVRTSAVDEDKLISVALDAGAEDVSTEGEVFQVLTGPSEFVDVAEAIQKAGIPVESSELALIPDTTIPVTDKSKAGAILRFIEALEELDDVQNVYSNYDMDDELMEELSPS